MLLKVDKLNKTLFKKQLLFDISFDVWEGEMYGFLWPNWAWKTTTMKCILWFLKADSWYIEIFWEKWLNQENKKKIGFMPENTYLYKYLTAREFLTFNWSFFWLSKLELKNRIDELLETVWLSHASDKYLKQYSKWMLQRVWLAQSIINKPKLLFLDEPMSWLDPIWRRMLKDLLLKLKQEWTTIFFNTHILSDVESICDKISIIHRWHMIVSSKSLNDINTSLEDFFIEKVNEFDHINLH